MRATTAEAAVVLPGPIVWGIASRVPERGAARAVPGHQRLAELLHAAPAEIDACPGGPGEPLPAPRG
jgi:hypothetical protein